MRRVEDAMYLLGPTSGDVPLVLGMHPLLLLLLLPPRQCTVRWLIFHSSSSLTPEARTEVMPCHCSYWPITCIEKKKTIKHKDAMQLRSINNDNYLLELVQLRQRAEIHEAWKEAKEVV